MAVESEITHLLEQIDAGKVESSTRLLPLVYTELRQLASAKLSRDPANETLQATALVHEAWIKLGAGGNQSWNGRQHFFRAAALAMRRILVDRARKRLRLKRGNRPIRTELSESKVGGVEKESEEILRLNDALDVLKERDAQAAEIVHLRYFAGMNMADAADVLGISLRSAERLWTHTKAWLRREMSG